MAQQIIDNLLISGAIMRGTFFHGLQNKYPSVVSHRKDVKKYKSISSRTR